MLTNIGKSSVDLEEALEIAGLGWYNLKYSLVLNLVLIAVIMESVGSSYVLPASKCDLEMSVLQRGFIASEPYLGIILTSFIWGYLQDTQGRKRVAIISSLGAGFFAILSGFMPELVSFIICKFLCALCIAGPATVPYAFIVEILPQKHRDCIMIVVNALQIAGSVLVPLQAWLFLPHNVINFGVFEVRAWRVLAVANASFFILSATLLCCGPESPKYLVARGRHDEALIVLRTIYAKNKRRPPEDYPVTSLRITPSYEPRGQHGFYNSLKEQSLPLFKPPYLKWFLLNASLLIGVFATLNGLYIWIPDILNRVITGKQSGYIACEIIAMRMMEVDKKGECDDYIAPSIYAINACGLGCCAVLAILLSLLTNFIGKKALLVLLFFVIGTFCILINFLTKEVLYVPLLSSFPMMTLTIGAINAYASEIFPIHLRGMAISMTMMIGRIGSVMGANIAGILLNAACSATFYVFGFLLISCSLLSLFLPKLQENLLVESKTTKSTSQLEK